MRCFVHQDREAIAVCKRCGKAMCVDCSAFTGHSSICPVCTLEMINSNISILKSRLKSLIAAIVFAIIIPVFLLISALVIGDNLGDVVLKTVLVFFYVAILPCIISTIICAVKINKNKKLLTTNLNDKAKIETALAQGRAQIKVEHK